MDARTKADMRRSIMRYRDRRSPAGQAEARATRAVFVGVLLALLVVGTVGWLISLA